MSHQFIRWFAEISIDDVPSVGGKNASLGEMYRELVSQGVNVPNGFAITADAYRFFLNQTGTDRRIREILQDLNSEDIVNLQQRGKQVRQAILQAELPDELQGEIVAAYDQFCAAAQERSPEKVTDAVSH